MKLNGWDLTKIIVFVGLTIWCMYHYFKDNPEELWYFAGSVLLIVIFFYMRNLT